jgi:hypothetical protein
MYRLRCPDDARVAAPAPRSLLRYGGHAPPLLEPMPRVELIAQGDYLPRIDGPRICSRIRALMQHSGSAGEKENP